MPSQPGQHKRRWRQYKTASGNEPVREFLFQLSAADRAEIAIAMKEVEDEGLSAARHLRGDLYEVRADGQTQISVSCLRQKDSTARYFLH
jgi:hypothetical protein